MMNKLLVLLLILLLATLGFILYEGYFYEPQKLNLIKEVINPDSKNITYGNTPMFMENLRFSNTHLSYYFEPTCPKNRKDKMKRAFALVEEKVGILHFYEEKTNSADILIGCSNDYIDTGENIFIAGEGGPSRIINTSNFNTIQTGKISLYKEGQCEEPLVELHELLHVLGFGHSKNPKSIMYDTSKCNQEITEEIIQTLKDLYSIPTLAELEVVELKAITRIRYLDFNITITNTGLIDARETTLSIMVGEKEIEMISIKELPIGYSRTVMVQNMRIPLIREKEITFIIDSKGEVKEFNEENNEAILKTS